MMDHITEILNAICLQYGHDCKRKDAEIARLTAELAQAMAELESLRNSTVSMPAWVCPKCGRSHPMIESGCPCFYDNIKITTGTVSTPRRIEPKFEAKP